MRSKLKIKVCGMKSQENINEASKLGIDLMGFIFVESSSRFLKEPVIPPGNVLKVGVFKDSEDSFILKNVFNYNLDFIQLHGQESPDFCKQIKEDTNLKIIKAISVDKQIDNQQLQNYSPFVDFFLFDTRTGNKTGGTGRKFNWEIINSYKLNKPFFLAGGINKNDAEEINKLTNESLYGIDLNSGFETEPGLKDINKLAHFLKELENE